MKFYRGQKELGSGGTGIAACMLGFSLVYFICYFMVNWIYDTKEARRFGPNHFKEELRIITKEEVMKRGIGQHVFTCSGLFSNGCALTESQDTVATIDYAKAAAAKKKANHK